MSQPLIISAFPGTGKSFIFNNKPEHAVVHDSDSSKFSWIQKGERHPDWPNNYIEHIKSLTGIVFVSSHEEVRRALEDAGLAYYTVYPSIDCKEEYLQRYKERGSLDVFIELLSKNWEDWIKALQSQQVHSIHYVLDAGVYLADILPTLVSKFAEA